MRKPSTQLQATPTLYGDDARAVLAEISRKPTEEQRQQLREKYRKMFEDIQVKGRESNENKP